MNWCIYVGQAAKKNFRIGFENEIWGHKTIFKNIQLRSIKPGDTLYFVHHLKKLKGAVGDIKDGFPRVDTEKLFGVIASLTRCEVTSHYFESNDEVWPDDIYSHRFHFKMLEQHENINFGMEFFSESFVSAVRDSLLKKGSLIPFTPSGDQVIFNDRDPMEIEVEEGAPVFKTHLRRERNREIVKLKKVQALKINGALKCEVCRFDFLEVYGARGEGFMECHHENPLSDTEIGQKTSLDDLALLCSNCHRIIHRSKPWIGVEELKGILNESDKRAAT